MDESTKLGSHQRNYKTLLAATHDNQEVEAQGSGELGETPKMLNSVDIMDVSQSSHSKEAESAIHVQKDKKNRVPRRVIHFSDGVIEEFSTDSEEEEEKRKTEELEKEKKKKALIDPRKLTWLPWMLYYTWFMGSSTLSYCDSVGEKLAWWFGITSPKYYYEIQEFERMKEEEEEEEKKRKVDEHGWSNVSSPEALTNPSAEQPKIQLQGLNPKNLPDSRDPHFTRKREIKGSTNEEGLHTVDSDPESQTKHY